MALKLYFDFMSQPSRACYIFLKANKLPFEPRPIALRKFEQKSEEFAAINPFQKLPVIDDNGFILTESMAILQYLPRRFKTPDHWYPKDLQKQARIDEYLHWHHRNVRLNGGMYFMAHIKSLVTGKPAPAKVLAKHQNAFNEACDLFEKHFLGANSFISADAISVADLQAVAELQQLVGIGWDIFGERPKLAAWRDRVRAETKPHYDDVNNIWLGVGKKLLEKLPKEKLE